MSLIPRRRFLPIACLALVAGTAVPAARGQEALPGIFSDIIEVSVVNVEVVVTDKDGNRVQGLRPEDFVLRVDGKEVPIDYFTEVWGGKAVAADTKGAKGEEAAPGLPSLRPGEDVETSYLVFIDDFFSLPRDRNLVLKRLMDQLPLMGPHDRMAVVGFNGQKLDMLTTWSQSLPALERTLRQAIFRPALGVQRTAEFESLKAQLGSPGTRLVGDRPLETDGGRLLDANERAFADLRRHQVENVVRAAIATLRGFAQPPGRKVMLLLSGGWPFDPFFYAASDPSRPIFEPGSDERGAALFRQLTDTANVLGYTLYPVDVPGLSSVSPVTAEESLPPDLLRLLAERTLARNAGRADSRNIESRALITTHSDFNEEEEQSSLHYLAAATGGRVLLNAQRRDAFESAVSDTRSYYWLGFTPEKQGDDERHRIAVSVRRPGLTVRTRHGFLHASRENEVTMMTESALLFGNAPSSKRLPVELGTPTRHLNTMEVPLTLQIPMDSVTMVPANGLYRGQVELRVAALDDHGRRSDIPVIRIPISGDTEPEPGSISRYQTTLKLRKDAQQVVVSVHDAITGEILSSSLDIKP